MEEKLRTSGEELKIRLGLDGIENVLVSRALMTSYYVLFIYYDSYRPTFPITYSRLRKLPRMSSIFYGRDIMRKNKLKNPIMTPLLDIEDYNGNLDRAIILPVDLAGTHFVNDKIFTRKVESISRKKGIQKPKLLLNGENKLSYLNSIFESLQLSDLTKHQGTSDVTKYYRKERNGQTDTGIDRFGNVKTNKKGEIKALSQKESSVAKLHNVQLNRVENYARFSWLTPATAKYPANYNYKKTDKNSNFALEKNNTKEYELVIQIKDFFDWLETIPKEKGKITSKDIKEILEVSDIALYSESPSFHWQGFNYWLTQMDASIYPTNIAPKQWDKIHGDGEAFIDKHLDGLIAGIGFWYNPMASMLTAELKRGDYI